jgi:hypothetical protein
MFAMKSRLAVLLLCAAFVPVAQARATTLPDACGDDKVKFDVKTEDSKTAPAPPAEGKAQIVLIETMDKSGMIGGDATTRFGMDGVWVGANKGSSYFTLDVAPGEHHLCAGWQSVFGKLKQMVGQASFTAEAGKVYYFEAKAVLHVHQYGGGSSETDRNLVFVQLNEDEGKYRVKAWKLATSKPKK